MSFKNRFLQPSFRGVPWHNDDHGVEGGRRPVPHEFIGRDEPFTDEMGRRVRIFPVKGYVIGRNFDLQMTALRLACEAPGPGLLIHPWFGLHNVICDTFAFNVLREKGGMASFSATFLERGAISPRPAPSFRVQLPAAARSLGAVARGALGRIPF